jgi:hypothetical protein
MHMRETEGVSALPVFLDLEAVGLRPTSTVSTAQFTLPGPAPTSATPLEAILEYRLDADTTARYRQVLELVSAAMRTQRDFKDFRTELAEMLYDYEEHVRVQHKLLQLEQLQTIVVGTAEVIEDFAKFRISRLLTRGFDLAKARHKFREFELKRLGQVVVQTPKT